PRPANIVHHLDASSGNAWWTSAARPAWRAPSGAFSKATPPGLTSSVYAAPAPAHDGKPVRAEVLSVTADGAGRRVRLRIAAEGADVVTISIPESAEATALSAGGAAVAFDKKGSRALRCTGRACADFTIEATIELRKTAFDLYAFRYGLDAAGAPLLAARPATDTPLQMGDGRRVWSRIEL
ncbi:MAG: hypothetical protein K2Q06_02010, partial [Parvularculaceae bacterium]|nr:hypothetical protein [Parvularculaceae bacterium]